MTPIQISTARLALGLTRLELAKAAGVSEATVLRMEKPKAKSSSLSRNKDLVVAALKARGVTVSDEGRVSVPTKSEAE
jgi:transcriptional regulator with XRE-family HTH domain